MARDIEGGRAGDGNKAPRRLLDGKEGRAATAALPRVGQCFFVFGFAFAELSELDAGFSFSSRKMRSALTL